MTMHVVIVSSPGVGPGPHWSRAAAAALATEVAARGRTVTWLAVGAGALIITGVLLVPADA